MSFENYDTHSRLHEVLKLSCQKKNTYKLNRKISENGLRTGLKVPLVYEVGLLKSRHYAGLQMKPGDAVGRYCQTRAGAR